MPQSARTSYLRHLINIVGPFAGLLLVIGLFSLSSEIRPYFLAGGNFKIILTQTVIVATAALGMTLVIISGGIDLSVGSAVALTSVVGALALDRGHSAFTAAVATIAVGAIIGAINGTVIGAFRLLPFIVTLGMMGIARGLAKMLSGSQTVNPAENALNQLMATSNPNALFPLPMGVWLTVLLAVATHLVMHTTVFGRYIFAIGANEAAARLSGVRVGLWKALIYAFAGLFVGMAGLMQFSRLGQGDPTGALSLELDVIAAVVIGGASLSGGSGSILGSMIGALIMAVLRNGSNQMGWPTYVQEIIIGVVIIVAVGLDHLRHRKV